MKVILHIGTGKTGTTSLQKFFHLNRSLLENNGILFPHSVGYTNHIEVAMYGISDISKIKQSLFLKKQNVCTLNEKNLFDYTVEQKLSAELTNSKNLKFLLISSEHLSTSLRSFEEVQKIKLLFDKLKLEVTCIIIYLRDQVSYLFSNFSTRVLLGSKTGYRPCLPTKLGISPINYAHTLNMWESSFPKAEIQVRIFEKNNLKNSDIITDFLDFLNIDALPNINKSTHSNTSLSASALYFLIKYNNYVHNNPDKHLPSLASHKVQDLLIPFAKCFFVGKPLIPTMEEKNKIENLCFDCNEQIRTKYFPQKQTLFKQNDDKYSLAEEKICSEVLFENSICVLAHILKELK